MNTPSANKQQGFLSQSQGRAFLVFFILIVSLAIRVVLFHIQGCKIDESCFLSWFDTAAKSGLHSFYYDTLWSDYPPFNVYIFWIFGKLASVFGSDSLSFFIKLPQNLFDIATAFLIYSFLRRHFSFKVALGVMALYAFNPAVIFDLAVWGQMDSIYTFFMVASLYAALEPTYVHNYTDSLCRTVENRIASIKTIPIGKLVRFICRIIGSLSGYELAGSLLALAVLTKPQSIVLLPLLIYIAWRNKGWWRVVSSGVAFCVMTFLVILPFDWTNGGHYSNNPLVFLYHAYSGYSVYEYNSINAYNFWALFGFWKPDTEMHFLFTYQIWGIIAFLAVTLLILWLLHRNYSKQAAIYAAFLLMFGFFMVMTRMHERYLFPVFALLAMGWLAGSSLFVKLYKTRDITINRLLVWAVTYLGLTATFLANLVYVLSELNADPVRFIPDGHWSIYVLTPINMIVFALSIWFFYRMQLPGMSMAGFIRNWFKYKRMYAAAVALLMIVFFSIAAWNLGDMKAPATNWTPQDKSEAVILDIGSPKFIDNIYFFSQNSGHIDIDLYWDSAGEWIQGPNLKIDSQHKKWEQRSIKQETRYLKLVSNLGTSTDWDVGKIGEIALYSGNERLSIVSATGSVNGDGTALIDEQKVFSHPQSNKATTYFDEIYYVRAAEDHLKLENPGEITHPPTSKLIIGLGMAIFGHTPFGYRIMGVIFATLMIPLIYVFARDLFKSQRAGLLAAFLLAFDFMHFVESRIATPETFILFFIMAMFYCFLRYIQKPENGGKFLFLSLVFFGLGFSTKWVTMWGFIGLMILLVLFGVLFNLRNKPIEIHRNEILGFIAGAIAAVAIYFISYIPYFLAGHGLHDWWDFQFSMYDFHAHLKATHPWSSKWWSWPVMLKPVYMYSGTIDDKSGYISTFGNPALWWVGIPCMIAMLWLAIKNHSKVAIFILIPFLTQWLIFSAIGRCLFIYHFYPNVLFLVLAVTFCMNWIWSRCSWSKWPVSVYLMIVVACFAAFFPAISGYPMTEHYWQSVSWIREWIWGTLF